MLRTLKTTVVEHGGVVSDPRYTHRLFVSNRDISWPNGMLEEVGSIIVLNSMSSKNLSILSIWACETD